MDSPVGLSECRIHAFPCLSLIHIYPVDGTIKKVAHHNGNFMKAWLPKASTENERSTVVIETPEGVEVLTRQIAGAVARRIVTYAEVCLLYTSRCV